MSAIGKTFDHHGEKFVVMIEGHDHYICTSLRDKRAWRFGIEELRDILNGRT